MSHIVFSVIISQCSLVSLRLFQKGCIVPEIGIKFWSAVTFLEAAWGLACGGARTYKVTLFQAFRVKAQKTEKTKKTEYIVIQKYLDFFPPYYYY
jgi:hypothetical protein